MKRSTSILRAIVLAACSSCPLSAQLVPAPQPLTPDTEVVAVAAVVRTALTDNLELLARLEDTREAALALRRALGSFDPILSGAPARSRASGERYATGGSGTEPLHIDVTSWSSALSGRLSSGADYRVGVESESRSGDPALPAGLRRGYDNALTLSVTQPLLRGFGIGIARADVVDARLGERATAGRAERAAETVVAAVCLLYWSLEFAEDVERERRSSAQRAGAFLERQQELQRLERLPAAGVLAADAGFAIREADLIAARQQREDAMERLLFAVYGERASSRIRQGTVLLTDTVDAPLIPVLSGMEQEEEAALRNRPDHAAAALETERASATLRVSRNSLLPQVDLSGGLILGTTVARRFGFSTDVLSPALGSAQSRDWTAGLRFSWPLLNRRASAERELARIDLLRAQLALAASENLVRSEVRAAVRAIHASRARLERARAAARLSRAHFSSEQQLLELGRSDPFRLLQVEEQLADAELAAEAAENEVAFAIVQYRLANGTLLRHFLPGGWTERRITPR